MKNNIYIQNLEANVIYNAQFRGQPINNEYLGCVPYSLTLAKVLTLGMKYKQDKISGICKSDYMINVCFSYDVDHISKTINWLTNQLKTTTNTDWEQQCSDRLDTLIGLNKENLFCEQIKSDELREKFYEDGFTLNDIDYVLFQRSSSKSRTGNALFIKKELHKQINHWCNMGIEVIPNHKMDVAGWMAYTSLVSSHIHGTININPQNILLVNDVDSVFMRDAKVVQIGENGHLESVSQQAKVKNSLFDGQSLLDESYFNGEGMKLLRNHFFKSCAFNTNVIQFMKDYAEANKIDYDTWELIDMFDNVVLAKDVHCITTPNSLKALKFTNMLGEGKTNSDMYEYWKKVVIADGCVFGVVKSEYTSKLGDRQRMSYQMVNCLDATKEEVRGLAQYEIDYIMNLKNDTETYVKMLECQATDLNSNQMWADLYRSNSLIAQTKAFKDYRKHKISEYKSYVKGGKISLSGDYAVVCGNGEQMLYHAIGRLPVTDKCVIDSTYIGELKDNEINTTLHPYNAEYVAFRNPNTSANNIGILKNVENEFVNTYFNFTKNIVMVNAINFEIQDIFSSMDMDSDVICIFNHRTLLKVAHRSVDSKKYPVILNEIKSEPTQREYNLTQMAKIDNILAESTKNIGTVVNHGQFANSLYWDKRNDEVLEIIDICGVLSCVAIDLSKKMYEIKINEEIKLLLNHKLFKGCKKPNFWAYINDSSKMPKMTHYNTPMDYLGEVVDEGTKDKADTIKTMELSKVMAKYEPKQANSKQKDKVLILFEVAMSELDEASNIKSKDIRTAKITNIYKHLGYKLEKLTINIHTLNAIVSYINKSDSIDTARALKMLECSQESFSELFKAS